MGRRKSVANRWTNGSGGADFSSLSREEDTNVYERPRREEARFTVVSGNSSFRGEKKVYENTFSIREKWRNIRVVGGGERGRGSLEVAR